MGLDDIDHTLYIRVNVQLLCPVVDVYQQQVVQKQVLDKVILIKTLLISYQQVLNLECGQFANHVYIIAGPLC